MITLSRARHQIPGLERKRYWNSGLARKDLSIFPVPVCLETFRLRGGGYGIAFKKNPDQKYLFFHFQNKSCRKNISDFSRKFSSEMLNIFTKNRKIKIFENIF